MEHLCYQCISEFNMEACLCCKSAGVYPCQVRPDETLYKDYKDYKEGA